MKALRVLLAKQPTTDQLQYRCPACDKPIRVGQNLCMYAGLYRHAECMPPVELSPDADRRILEDSCCVGRVPGTFADVRPNQDVSAWR